MKKYELLRNKKKLITAFIIRFIIKLGNFFCAFAICLLLYALLRQPNMMVGALICFPVFIIINLISVMRYVLSFQGVKLYDDFIKFKSTNSRRLNKKIKLFYKDINAVETVSNELVCSSFKNKKVFLCGEEGHYVKLSSKKGKEYYLPIADTENFINDVLMRCNIEKNTES